MVLILQKNNSSGTTGLGGLSQQATEDYFLHISNSQIKLNSELILVINDGEPDNCKAVMKVIIETS
jgi:hypothetical protein